MTTKPSLSFTCKKLFTNPCKNFINLFKFKLRKPIFKRTLRSRKPKPANTSFFRSSRKTSRDMDRVMKLKSFSEAGKEPCPSPLTPAYIKMARVNVENMHDRVEEDACRSFEKYLLKMIAEEGRMRDLVDVEELLYCWKNLKSPVFVNLVCRFYGELCHDLFPCNVDEDKHDDVCT